MGGRGQFCRQAALRGQRLNSALYNCDLEHSHFFFGLYIRTWQRHDRHMVHQIEEGD